MRHSKTLYVFQMDGGICFSTSKEQEIPDVIQSTAAITNSVVKRTAVRLITIVTIGRTTTMEYLCGGGSILCLIVESVFCYWEYRTWSGDVCFAERFTTKKTSRPQGDRLLYSTAMKHSGMATTRRAWVAEAI